jgi:hypothetical protein
MPIHIWKGFHVTTLWSKMETHEFAEITDINPEKLGQGFLFLFVFDSTH